MMRLYQQSMDQSENNQRLHAELIQKKKIWHTRNIVIIHYQNHLEKYQFQIFQQNLQFDHLTSFWLLKLQFFAKI